MATIAKTYGLNNVKSTWYNKVNHCVENKQHFESAMAERVSNPDLMMCLQGGTDELEHQILGNSKNGTTNQQKWKFYQRVATFNSLWKHNSVVLNELPTARFKWKGNDLIKSLQLQLDNIWVAFQGLNGELDGDKTLNLDLIQTESYSEKIKSKSYGKFEMITAVALGVFAGICLGLFYAMNKNKTCQQNRYANTEVCL